MYLSGSVDGTGSYLLDILEELGLGCAGVTTQQDVDVSTNFVFVLKQKKRFCSLQQVYEGIST